MRILHLVARSHRRGAEMAALELARELDLLGHSNRVVALTGGLDGRIDPAIDVLREGRNCGPGRFPVFAWMLRRELRRRPADVVFLHGGSAAEVAALAMPRGGPVLLWQRILGFPPQVWHPLRRRWVEAVASRVDAAIALTPDLGVELRRLGFVGPVWTIANSRQPNRFLGLDHDQEGAALRQAIGVVDPDTHLIGFVGHLVEQKQPLRALEVVQAVRKRGVPAHLVMAGGGPLRPMLEMEIKMRGLESAVTLLGHRDDVERVYAGVELVVLTSEAEGIPGVAIEAQMAGCPVVTFPVGGVRQVVRDGETGVVLPHADSGAMADSVVSLLTDPERRAAMSERARTTALDFSAAHAARMYHDHLDELCSPDQDRRTGLRLYWYWPFARAENIELAAGAVNEGDTLVVETLDRKGVPHWKPDDRFVVINDVPEVRSARERSIAWVLSRGWTYLSRVVRRRRTLRRGSFDLVHVMFPNRFTDAVDLALLSRRYPLVCSIHDAYPHDQRLPLPVERWLSGLQFRHSGRLAVHNENLRTILIDDFHVDPSRIELVPHMVSRFDASLGIQPDDPPMVLFFGTMRRNKGVQVLIDAIGHVRGDVAFHFAGRGFDDVEAEVQALTDRDARVTAELEWIDASRKSTLFRRATLVALPYTSFESESGVLHDAYGHGKPVVVTDLGALGPSVRRDRTGWVVPPGDPKAFAAAIEAALADPVAYDHAVVAAEAVADAKRPAVAGAHLRQLYTRMLATRRSDRG